MARAAVRELDPASLVARIIAELDANPAAQPLLLRALLTNEFRGVPLRLDRIEADIREMKIDVQGLKSDGEVLKADVKVLKSDVEVLKSDVKVLKSDVKVLKADVKVLKSDVKVLKSDVAELKGDCLEFKLPQRIRAFLSQKLGLRRARIMQSTLGLQQGSELSDAVADAAEAGAITDAEETRVLETDLILCARRKRDGSDVWVAVEASHTVDGYDIDRARESAAVLRRMFGTDSVAAAVGYGVRAGEQARAEAMGVEVFVIRRRAA